MKKDIFVYVDTSWKLVTMPIIHCPITDCDYVTEDVEAALAAALLILHNNAHTSAPPAVATTNNKQRAPKIERPRLSAGSSQETWNAFITRWGMFTRGTMLSADERVQHLFQCCAEELDDAILQGQLLYLARRKACLLL